MALLTFTKRGDFYETYDDQAGIAAKILDLVVTTRRGDRPMTAIPAYCWTEWSEILTANGYSVVCDG